MGNIYQVTNSIVYVGVNDHQIDLFEGQYSVPNGMSYNSYVILDEQIAVMDTVDAHFEEEWFENLAQVLGTRQPDYLIVQHMEMDHAANIANFMNRYPSAKIVGNSKTFAMMKQFFHNDFMICQHVVKNGDTLSLGAHELTFVFAPMVHWPEVMVTYDALDKVLFSADGFGKFGAQDVVEPWDDEARRYYIGIVGKYGKQVQNLLKVASTLHITKILPLHGPILTENLGHYLKLYDIWSSYRPESEGVVVAYTSVYGNTKRAAEMLALLLSESGCPKVVIHDLARGDMAQAVADAFRYETLVLATTTYNKEVYPFMHDFLHRLSEHAFQKRTVAMIENGSWSPNAANVMRSMLEGCKELHYTAHNITIRSALNVENFKEMVALVDELCSRYPNYTKHIN